MHLARWMAKAIYCLKLFMFRSEFKLSKSDLNGLLDVCIFIVKFYVQFWFKASTPVLSPYNDLLFLQSMIHYEKENAIVSSAALKKLAGHLWYLTPEMISLALFDLNVPIEEKKKLC